MTPSPLKSPAPSRATFPLLLFQRRWILTTLLVLAASIVMIRLGFWQLDRLAQKRAYIASALAEIEAEPLTLAGAETDLDPEISRYRRALAEGEYDFSDQVVLKSQLYQDQPGYHLLTPFLIAGSDRAVLVDRGWIPATSYEPGAISQFDEPQVTSIAGRIEPGDRRPSGAELPIEPQLEWYRVDIPALQAQMPYELLPFYVALTPSDDHTILPYRNPPEIILDEGPHLGYAIQWFLFATIVPIAYAVQVRRMDRDKSTAETAISEDRV